MNEIVNFNFGAAVVRTVVIDGEPWFVAKDVAKILGYEDTDGAIRKHCKRRKTSPVESAGQVRHVVIIPEADVYRLIMRSKLESAERFEAWVSEEVLPMIRKTGSYTIAKPLTREQQIANALLLSQEIITEQNQKLIEQQYTIIEQQEIIEDVTEQRDDLKEELGFHGTFRSIKAYYKELKKFFDMTDNEVRKAIGKELKRCSDLDGAPVKKVPDFTFGQVNAYHVDLQNSLKILRMIVVTCGESANNSKGNNHLL